MYLRSWVVCGIAFVLASASLGCGQPPQKPVEDRATEEEDLTPASNEVIIKVNCPPRAGQWSRRFG